MVGGGQDAAADTGRQARFELAALAAAEALDLQAETGLEGVEVLERRVVVGVPGHRQGAAAAVADRSRRERLQLGGERAPARRSRQVQVEERLLAVVDLGDRGEHA